ncbi:ATPase associated with various cellular activities AAA_3 [Thermobaculum terrenum ATCC BAA-798]|uniref:ATPase associated with various cellular activities AAA_3 n=1 Tax=Thermobaculum terrenum (strain ATCC BAA-798 / CCMEE 7001 / YNP1) TaxID=525904 RepID=D1CCX9_THET1|nr:AAA family ATPase [Thermobaculum terrenum]ACZ42644.1 ATPase associated with various cellular activities AAA_3 [Thermobaculum terrenum ATCC BAA-798]
MTNRLSISPDEFTDIAQRILSEVSKRIVGQRELVEGTLICILSGGHALLEGLPGLGKTMTVRTFAEVLDLHFSRIQFTPDLMPSDITGTNVLEEDASGARRFRFQEGPIFANLVLADEINRATPKTQSALLEAMQEHAVTVGNDTHALPKPFFVLATQNPIDLEGTYPLPEAQLDRFMFKLLVPSPSPEELVRILETTTTPATILVEKVADADTINQMRMLSLDVPVAPHVLSYVSELVLRTHPDNPAAPASVKRYVRFGSSPRGAQALVLGAKVKALLEGRYNVAVEDINEIAAWALRHRIILNYEGESENISTESIVRDIVESLVASLTRI